MVEAALRRTAICISVVELAILVRYYVPLIWSVPWFDPERRDRPYTEVESLLKRLPPIPVYASDVALVFLALYYGGSINHYEEFAEMFYPNISELLVENKVAFLHQVKHDYKNELTDDETNRLYPK